MAPLPDLLTDLFKEGIDLVLGHAGPRAADGGGDQHGEGLRLAGQEPRRGDDDPGEDTLGGHAGSLLGETTGA
jgi:hypothetical protein